jgi:hypothetical protein
VIVRRRTWTYLALGMRAAKKLSFNTPVNKQQVNKYIVEQLKKIPVKVWAQ